MKNVITYLKALWRRGLGSQSSDVSLDCRLTVGSPSVKCGSTLMRLVAVMAILLTVGVGNVWGTLSSPYTCTFTSDMSMDGSNCTTGDVTWTVSTTTGAGSPGIEFGNQNGQSCIKLGAGKKNYYSEMTLTTSAFTSYNVTSVVIYASSNNGGSKTFKVTQGATQIGTGDQSFSSTTWVTNITRNTNSGSGGDLSIEISSDATATFIHSITVTYTSTPSCSASPTVGNAANNGALVYSTTPMTVPVTCPSIGAGASCSIKEYGFVWKASGNPTISNNKTPIGTDNHSTAFSGNISGTFAAGTTYYVKAYAINNGDKTTLSTGTYSFTPRSITMNSNGGSAVTTILVISGTAATQPANPTKTGYTFGGWYTDNGTFASAVNWSSNITSNQTYYAKWTAKTYTIDLDQDLTPTSAGTTSITATYNSNSNLTSAITPPTKTGWTFAGYYTEKNGSGTQIIDAEGNVIANVATYTDASKNWIKAGGVTLYAKWTCTVTWSVSGATNVYSAHTLTYNGTSTKVASIPGPPNPASYCGDKFVGWTSVENYVHGTSNLFTTVAGSPELKTVGNTTFYAVFADYDE